MSKHPLHSWNLTPAEAIRLQRELEPLTREDLPLGPVRRIAGTDVAYEPGSRLSLAVVCVLEFPGLQVVEWQVERAPTPFPYVPGLLSFREVPLLLAAFDRLQSRPDLILVDGHGRAHPRRLGIASHLGLWLKRPTIGVGKSVLCGTCDAPETARGSWTPLIHRGEEVGRALRTRERVKPVYVSPGFGLTQDQCVEWVLVTASRFRLPEPIRWADRLAAREREAHRASRTGS